MKIGSETHLRAATAAILIVKSSLESRPVPVKQFQKAAYDMNIYNSHEGCHCN
jgi:hypothetical protein